MLTETDDFQPNICPSKKLFFQPGIHCFAVWITVLAFFSTTFSGIYMIIALQAPRWNKIIDSRGKITPDAASVTVQLLAKLIELSFVTVCIIVIGQIIS